MDATPLPAADLLSCVIAEAVATTTPPDETPPQAQSRAAFIAALFHALAPNDAMEAAMACQVVMLRYALMGAMRALSMAGDDKARLRLQSALNGLSRTAHQWLTTYQKTQARRRTDLGNAENTTPGAAKPLPQPAPAAQPASPSRQHQTPASPPRATPGNEGAAPRMPALPASPLVEALLASLPAPLPGQDAAKAIRAAA